MRMRESDAFHVDHGLSCRLNRFAILPVDITHSLFVRKQVVTVWITHSWAFKRPHLFTHPTDTTIHFRPSMHRESDLVIDSPHFFNPTEH